MFDVEQQMKVWGSDEYRIRLGWMGDEPERSVMFAWRDCNGNFSRGSQKEVNVGALARMYVFARAHGHLTEQDIQKAYAEIASGANDL